jgi:glycosyltransferase involved in cell wall biosynthesis
MPVYNAGEYVREAIQSLLDQTFQDFELIVIDDGSEDNSLAIIRSFVDDRIKVLSHHLNIGNYPCRNEGIAISKGKYICAMDADDVALKNRLERQYIFMENHPKIGLAGSGFRYYGNNQDIFRDSNYERIKINLLRNNCFIHPTIIVRNDLIKKHKLYYDEKYFYAADYDLIVRAARCFYITNINEVLLLYRRHAKQVTSLHRSMQAEFAGDISVEQIKTMGLKPTSDEIRIHLSIIKGIPLSYKDVFKVNDWINKIQTRNDHFYDTSLLKSFLESLLQNQSFCLKSEQLKIEATFLNSDKFNMSDCEILIPVHVDSCLRIENILTLIKYINHYFNITIRVLESGNDSSLDFLAGYKNIIYSYHIDDNLIYNKTVWVNQLVHSAQTEYIIIWDTDVLVGIDQLLESLNAIKTGKYSMALPYDGRVFALDKEMSRLLRNWIPVYPSEGLFPSDLMHGYHMVGGIYLVNRNFFIKNGSENENILGWGIEDAERFKRMEASGLPVFSSNGAMLHMFHPRGENSRFADEPIQKMNRSTFLKTCESC